MNKPHQSKKFIDPAERFRERPFDGRKELQLSIIFALTVAYILPLCSKLPLYHVWSEPAGSIISITALLFYFIGFWKALRSKGYPSILFILSFIPLLGLILIYFLPNNQKYEPRHFG